VDYGLWTKRTRGNGGKISELQLDAPPTFDGLIATQGQLLFTTMDGRLVCMGANE